MGLTNTIYDFRTLKWNLINQLCVLRIKINGQLITRVKLVTIPEQFLNKLIDFFIITFLLFILIITGSLESANCSILAAQGLFLEVVGENHYVNEAFLR